MWISRKTYNLMQELKTVAEHKALYFEAHSRLLARENRRLIERLLAKHDVPLVDSPENIIKEIIKDDGNVIDGMDLFEDEFGDPVITPRDANDERKRNEESDSMEYQP